MTAAATRKPSLMPALLIKDFRLCKPLIIAGLIAMFIPITAQLVDNGIQWLRRSPDGLAEDPYRANDFVIGLFAGLGLAAVTLPALAAVAAARERRDRSADFLHTLPIRRVLIVTSKAMVVIFWTLLLFAIGAIVMELVRPADSESIFTPGLPGRIDLTVASMFLAVYGFAIGVGWFAGSFLTSDTIAGATALGACLLFTFTLGYVIQRDFHFSWGKLDPSQVQFLAWLWTLLGVGAITFIAGTIISLRRKSP